jgi:hypothetical protein
MPQDCSPEEHSPATLGCHTMRGHAYCFKPFYSLDPQRSGHQLSTVGRWWSL